MTTTRQTETKTTGKCIRCGRKLTDPASIAAGMGRVCRSHTIKAAKVIDLSAFRNAQAAKDKATELVEQAGIIPAGRPGLYLAVASNGTDTYLVDSVEGSCTCKGFAHQGRCYHQVAAALMDARSTTRFAVAA